MLKKLSLIIISTLVCGASANAMVSIQTDVHINKDDEYTYDKEEALQKLEAEFNKEAKVFCQQSNQSATVSEINILGFETGTSYKCPSSDDDVRVLNCEESEKIPYAAYAAATMAGEVFCSDNPDAHPASRLWYERNLNAYNAVYNRNSDRLVMSVGHGYGCGNHYLFISEMVSCDIAKTEPWQNIEFSKDDICLKLQLLTDNGCQAASTSTVEIEASYLRSNARTWGSVYIINSENRPFLKKDIFGDYDQIELGNTCRMPECEDGVCETQVEDEQPLCEVMVNPF